MPENWEGHATSVWLCCLPSWVLYEPTFPVDLGEGDQEQSLSMVSINHLPTLVAREASEDFAGQLLPSLKMLDRRQEEGVWVSAERVFREKAEEMRDAGWGARLP